MEGADKAVAEPVRRSSPPPEITRKIRYDFFLRRISVTGLARKYGRTVAQIEEMLRWRSARTA